MKMFKWLALGAALSLSSGIANALEITLGHTLAPDSHYQAAAEAFKKSLEADSHGEITVSIFPQSQLGGEVKMIQAARTGSIGAFITATPPLENTVPQMSVLSLPYLFSSVDQANGVLQGDAGKKLLDYLPGAGLVGLNFMSVFERSVFGNKPVKTLADMKGMKLRVLQGPGFVKTYEALGAQPTPMAYSEVFVALQNHVVDGAEAGPDQVVQDKFMEVIKYFNMTKIHYMPAILIVSKPIFDSLKPEQQAMVRKAGDAAAKASLETYVKTYADALTTMKSKGIEIVEPDLADFKAKSLAVWPQLLNGVPDGEANEKMLQAAAAGK